MAISMAQAFNPNTEKKSEQSPHLLEIANRIRKLSYTEMMDFASTFGNFLTGNVRSETTHEIISALLSTAGEIEGN